MEPYSNLFLVFGKNTHKEKANSAAATNQPHNTKPQVAVLQRGDYYLNALLNHDASPTRGSDGRHPRQTSSRMAASTVQRQHEQKASLLLRVFQDRHLGGMSTA
jgi:hypothetical protein